MARRPLQAATRQTPRDDHDAGQAHDLQELLDEADVDPDLQRFFVATIGTEQWLQVTEVKDADYKR